MLLPTHQPGNDCKVQVASTSKTTFAHLPFKATSLCRQSTSHCCGTVRAPLQGRRSSCLRAEKSDAKEVWPLWKEPAAVADSTDRDLPKLWKFGLTLALGSTMLAILTSIPALAAEDSGSPTYHPVAADLQNLAQNEDFWSNLARYARYYVTVLLGTAYAAVKPLTALLKRPVSAAVVIGLLVGLFFFLNTTLRGMLGVNEDPLSLLDY